MGQALADIHAKILKKSRESRLDESKVAPESYVRRVADLEDPDEVMRVLMDRARQAQDCRLPHENTWKESFRAWMQILDPNKTEDKWRSKRFIPLLFQHIESAHPAIGAAVFGGSKIWQIIGEAPDGRDHADAMGHLLEHQARGKTRMKRAYLKMLWWSIVSGTGLIDHFWKKEMVERMKAVVEEDFDGAGQPIGEDGNAFDKNNPENQGKVPRKIKVMRKKLITAFDDPFVKSVNPFDAWLDPNGSCGDDNDWLFLRLETVIEKIVNAAESGTSHLDKAAVKEWLAAAEESTIDLTFEDEDPLESGMDLNAYDDLLDSVGYTSPNAVRDEEDKLHGGRRVVLLVYRSKGETFTIAPGGRIIGWSDNPNSHGKTGIVVHHNFEIDDSPYGRGIGTVLLPHQELVNENINRHMDAAEISLFAPIGVDRSRVSVLDEKFRWQPNALVRTRGDPKSALTRLEMPVPTDLAMVLDQHLHKDADDTSGMTEQARGITPAGINTATEFTGIQANIKTRTFMHVERMNETLELSANLLIELNQQYMTQKRVIQIIGEPGLTYRTIAPTDIVGDFIPKGLVSSARMAPAMRVQQLISLTQVIVPLIQQAPASPFLMKWIRMILEAAEIEDVDRIIPKNPEKVRDPWLENIALRKGLKLEPSSFDRHDLHVEAHGLEIQKVQQLIAEGGADPAELDALMTHNLKHMEMGQQMGAMLMGIPPPAQPPAAPPGGSPDRQAAQGMGAAMGSNGVPGKASPGPGTPPGRSA